MCILTVHPSFYHSVRWVSFKFYCEFVCMSCSFSFWVCVCVCGCVWVNVFWCVSEQQGPASQVLLRLQAEALQVGLHSHFLSPIAQSLLSSLSFHLKDSLCVFLHLHVFCPWICSSIVTHSYCNIKSNNALSLFEVQWFINLVIQKRFCVEYDMAINRLDLHGFLLDVCL